MVKIINEENWRTILERACKLEEIINEKRIPTFERVQYYIKLMEFDVKEIAKRPYLIDLVPKIVYGECKEKISAVGEALKNIKIKKISH